MSVIDYGKREVAFKVVLLGARGQKPALVEALYQAVPQDRRGKPGALERADTKTLFFDFLPRNAPQIRGFRVRVHIYGWAGKEPGEADIRVLLRGADGALLFGNLGVNEEFILTRLGEEGIPRLAVETAAEPAEALDRLMKKIRQGSENR